MSEISDKDFKNLKFIFGILISLLVAVVIFAVIKSVPFINKWGNSLNPVRSFTVSSEGKVIAEPDMAKISFSVVSEGKNLELLAQDNNKKMTAAIGFLKDQNIDEKDIKTTQYDLYPRYEYDEKKKTTFISGYTLTQTVNMKIRNLATVAKIIGGLPEAGINQIGSISFDVDDPERYLSEARNLAFKKAAEKARAMALANGVKLGKIISFSESYDHIGPVYRSSLAAAPEMAAAPTIQPGTQEIRVNVAIVYEIR